MKILVNKGELTQYCVLHLYDFGKNVSITENLDQESLNSPEKIISVLSGNIDFLGNETIDLLTYRIKNRLPLYVIYDFSNEWHLTDEYLDKLNIFFKNLGLDVDTRLLILNNKVFNNSDPIIERPNTLTYDWLALDGLYWLKKKPEKFTNLKLKNRPNLCNLVISKIKSKPSRAHLAYEFWKCDILKRCLFSTMGTLEEFKLVIDDKDFLDELDQRITNIGGKLVTFEEGRTNIEFACETSDRTIFNNSRLSCVHETAYFDFLNTNQWQGNQFLTEKFYRCIVNKTPFILYSAPMTYKKIENMGFNTFNSIIDLSFDSIYDGRKKMKDYCIQVVNFLNTNSENLDQIQEICDFNFNLFIKSATKENEIYQQRITNFLNG